MPNCRASNLWGTPGRQLGKRRPMSDPQNAPAGRQHRGRAAHLCRPETVCLFLCFRCSSASSCSCRTRSLALTSLRPRGMICGVETSGQLT